MVNETEALRRAGQVSIDKVEILSLNGTGFNVINQMTSFQVFEDVFSPFITGTITLYESLDLLNLFPLVGEEMLLLEWHTPTVEKKFYRKDRYYIYNMTEMQNAGDRSTLYVLHFISMDAIVNVNNKVNCSFQGRVSDIVRKILTSQDGLGTKKPINVEDTSNVTKFTANYWSPMKCVNYSAGTAINNNKSASYTFFENCHGLNFVALDTLYASPPLHTFNQNNYTRDVNSIDGTSYANIMKDYNKIQSIDIPEGFDYIDRASTGMYGNTMITVDPVTKKYCSKSYHVNDRFAKQKHLNQFSLVSKFAIYRSEQDIMYVPKCYGNYNGYTDVTNAGSAQQRRSLLKNANAFKVCMSTFGRSDYTVGQCVTLSIPAKDPYAGNDKHEDKILSGNYLIAALVHRISAEAHMCDMELIKDSLNVNLDNGSAKGKGNK